jgi:hypothetical protein
MIFRVVPLGLVALLLGGLGGLLCAQVERIERLEARSAQQGEHILLLLDLARRPKASHAPCMPIVKHPKPSAHWEL